MKPLKLLLHFFIGALVGVGLGYLLGATGWATEVLDRVGRVELGPGRFAVFLAGVPVLVFLLVLLHELGHLAGGRLAGFRAYLLLVGPLRVERIRERWTVGLNARLATWGGLAASAPDDAHNLRGRMALYAVAGPGTNLLTGAAVLVVLVAVAPESLPPVLHAWMIAFTLGSFILGVLTLIPGQAGGMYTDGGRLLRLLRTGPELEGDLALIALTGLSLAGRRPREWPEALVEQALSLPPDSLMGVFARQVAYLRTLDLGDVERARLHLDEALDHREAMGEKGGATIRLHGAFFYATHGGDVARARELLDEARESPLEARHLRPMAEAAVRMAEGDEEGARAKLDEARLLTGASMDLGSADAEEEWLRLLETGVRQGVREESRTGVSEGGR